MPFGGLLTAGISAGTGIVSSLIGSNASDNASNAQVKALQDLIARMGPAITDAQNWNGGAVQGAQTRLDESLQKQLELLSPFLKAGGQGVSDLAAGMAPGGDLTKSFDPSTVKMDPGFDFRLQQGLKALTGSAAAKGSATGGAAMKAAERYGQDYSSNEYDKAYGRTFNTFETDQGNQFNRLSYLANMGQAASNTAGGNLGTNAGIWGQQGIQGAQYGGQVGMQGNQIIGDAMAGQGNARASGYMGGANAWASGIGNASNNITALMGQLYKGKYGSK